MKKNKHLYQQIKLNIIEDIENGEYKPGDKIGTEKELCDIYDVSRSTIRRALEELEESNLIERLLGKGTFVKDSYKLESQNNKNLMVIVPVISQDFISNIITGIQEVANQKGYSMNLCITNNSIEKETAYLNQSKHNDSVGVILHPTNSKYYNPEVIKLIGKKPLIMTARYYKYIDCNYVVPNNFQGAFKAVNHLIELGHKNIGLISDTPNFRTSVQERIEGYKEALNSNNLLVNKKIIIDNLEDPCRLYASKPEKKDQILDIIKRFLIDNKDNLTAIFAINDFLARETIIAAKQVGMKVPNEISIVGFDNVILSEKSEPPLTTINWSQYDVGVTATRELINSIENKSNKNIKKTLPVNLVQRESTFKKN
ncbi:GntR family transcriptional regulator [Halanaerobium sp. Z-7514]|uniref:GntR family transcriptional regulator n=1 Tax=Halanaerobium polyolivorans TaxID=2886943 RepID=A0AAW4X1X5_9FIRM|nr:GntR family transcriptional regulator [Halanaerobium polyolivorans]MCC3145783.1 GntR family transcriptional regulator [Halanaerobium polyolivorans]